jgi:hypothetical protein
VCSEVGGGLRCGVGERTGAFNERVDEGTGFSGFQVFLCRVNSGRQTTIRRWSERIEDEAEEVDGGGKMKQERSSAPRLLCASLKIVARAGTDRQAIITGRLLLRKLRREDRSGRPRDCYLMRPSRGCRPGF